MSNARVASTTGRSTPCPPRAHSGYVPFEGGRTWYRITESRAAEPAETHSAPPAPVVVLHGGPGLAHHGCLAMARLATNGRSVVHYDQIGCGRSTHFPDADPTRWTIDLFIRELTALTRALGVFRFHLVGHSWGGMLGAEYALRHPEDLASLVICNSPASMQLWREAADRLIGALPDEIQRSIRIHEEAGTTDSPEYQRATAYVYQRHFCRVRPTPDDLRASLGQLQDDPTVYHTMNGPSEFTVTGSLREWSIVDRAAGITAPTLVLAGEYDEATPETWLPFVTAIPNVRSHVIAGASHTPHLEKPSEWLATVGAFIQDHDALSSP